MTMTSYCSTENTQHGLLVAFGEFLQQHGLISRLMKVPIKQKTLTFAPQTKLIEFLAGIMGGMAYLSDLNDGPRPLANDSIVAHAWGQAAFAHYSSVSRTLDACDDETVSQVQAAIDAFSQPFIRAAVHELQLANVPLVYDLDLMGQAVSATSTTYPAAAFGWMNDRVQFGYQVARVCFTTIKKERLWLSGFHHPGDTVSSSCLQELLRAAETQTGVRPRRRTELLRARLAAHEQQLQRPQRLLAQHRAKQSQLQQTHMHLREQIFQAEQLLKTPISAAQSARLAKRVQGWQTRLPRLEQQQARGERIVEEHQKQLQQLTQALLHLQTWLLALEADNRTNLDPPSCEVRIDSGFSSGTNLTWLIEMGYQVNSKAMSGLTTAALRKKLSADARWTRVGANADMILCEQFSVHACPYPLRLALERFKHGDRYQYATLLQFRDAGPQRTLLEWFVSYNGRQLIEAGNKELKSGVFQVQHLLSRSAAGIGLQVIFAGLAANAVHWSMPWLRTCASPATPKLTRALKSPKQMVRIAANSAARVQQTPAGTALQFAPNSALPGAILILKGVPAFQLPLGFG